MSRPLSTNLKKAIRLMTTDEDMHCLLSIGERTLEEPIYIVSDTVNVTSNGQEFIACPFEFSLPQEDEQVPKSQIRLQNVDQRIGMALELIYDPLTIRMQVILRSNPNVVEIDYDFMEMFDISISATFVEASIGVRSLSSTTYPNVKAKKSLFPGLFPI